MVMGHNFSVSFAIIGAIFSFLISLISYRFNLINKKSELLFLSFGFHRHFFKLYFKNFYSSLILIINIVLGKKNINPVVYKLLIDDGNKIFNPSSLISTINMNTGLLVIFNENNLLLVHALNDEYLSNFNFSANIAKLNNLNDDKLV
jgi:multisubunit Na+/H+ antiporter MnhE subunit